MPRRDECCGRPKLPDNRIRRVKKASTSVVFARIGSDSQADLDLDLDEDTLERELERSEFWVTKLLRACGGCLGSRRR